MQQITVRLAEDDIEELDAEADERGDSRSEYIREIIASRHDDAEEVARLQAEVADYEDEVTHLQAKVDDLQRQLQQANTRIDASNELVEAVQQEQSLQRQKAEAGLATRAKWWLFGMDE